MICLKSFHNLTFQEKLTVFKWRNHFRVRKWMYNSKPLSYTEHKSFLKTLSNPYFLVKENDKAIGVVNLKNNDIGLFANPHLKGRGKTLLKAVMENFTLPKFRVEVFYNNKRAVKLYEKFGFKKSGKKRVEGRRVFVMERIK